MKSDYPACFSLPLTGEKGEGVVGLLWQQQVGGWMDAVQINEALE